ncbi:MAG: tetratricopeptide repeat protein [Chitinophagaceae bacterium]|nr:MAG: Tetratricopeptide repeat protein [Bacteroidetes bacterium OLB11]MCC6448406.1 tetratricopeptide repeat protein [Chitinophagaceae bacterium]HMN31954.1 tetratricopeptide repeat protein [Chitinophagaceae bacterium]
MERIQKLKEILSQSPNDCFVLHALGLEYLKEQDIHTALNFFKQVLIQDEKYLGTYYHLAKTYEKLGDYNKAIEIYHRGIQIASQLKDNHAKNELQMALDDISDE